MSFVPIFLFSYFLCISYSVMCEAYSIMNLLIAVTNNWEFNCIEFNEIAELEPENEVN